MGYISDLIQRLGPAGVVVKAIIAALIGDGLILGFILLRRSYRKRYFARRDARALSFQQVWPRLVTGEIPYKQWRRKAFDRRVVESLALDALEAAPPTEAAQLLIFLRWLREAGLAAPTLPLENALINCCRERPRMLLPYLSGAPEPLREVLARVLAEATTSALGTDIIEMAGDPNPELRAPAARALAHAKPRNVLPILTEMVKDPVRIVRLRVLVRTWSSLEEKRPASRLRTTPGEI